MKQTLVRVSKDGPYKYVKYTYEVLMDQPKVQVFGNNYIFSTKLISIEEVQNDSN